MIGEVEKVFRIAILADRPILNPNSKFALPEPILNKYEISQTETKKVNFDS